MAESNLKEGQAYLLDGNVLVEATYNDNTGMWQLHEPEDRSSWLVLPNGKLQGLKYDSARNVFLLEPEPDLWNTGDLSEAEENTPKLPRLLRRAERAADVDHTGQLTLIRVSTGWKVMFGNPDFESGDAHKEVQILKTYKTLYEALSALLEA